MFVLFNFLSRKREEKFQPPGGPYRRPAEMPAPIHDPSKPKHKRKSKFKMPTVKPSKATKIFLFLIPVCLCLIGIGMVHDAPILGEGLKWGSGLALFVMGFFFGAKAVYTAFDD